MLYKILAKVREGIMKSQGEKIEKLKTKVPALVKFFPDSPEKKLIR